MRYHLHFIWLTCICLIQVACQPRSSSESAEYSFQSEASPLPFFSDIEVRDLNRDNIRLINEFSKHKITVVDFWASWCGPCRQEIPYIANLYRQYKDKGLGIVGISLDKDYSSWQQAISDLHMTWPQYSDLRGWEEHTAQVYDVCSIPYTMIVDQQARILKKGLRGEELSTFISDYLQKHP